MANEQERLAAEMRRNRGIDSAPIPVRIRRLLPDFLNSVNLKYVKLGYHYFINHAIYVATAPVLVLMFSAEIGSLSRRGLWRMLWQDPRYDYLASTLSLVCLLVFIVFVYSKLRPRSIYLIDFSCFRPSDQFKVSKEEFIELARKSGKFDKRSLKFQRRILQSSGIGDETYIPKSVISSADNSATMEEGRAEASAVMFGALDELFEKTRIGPKEIGVLVVNCSVFNPTPSLSAMIINHYNMRGDIMSYNLGGMGCTAGINAIELVRDILQYSPANYAVVVSTEVVGYNWYQGSDRSMLIPNCLFRMGCSALLLSNHRFGCCRAKYRLQHVVRSHKAADNRSFRCVYQEEDDEGFKGLKMSKEQIEIAGEALKTNITTLGPLVLPYTEQLFFFSSQIWRQFFSGSVYIPDYKQAFDHFCVHAASKEVLNVLQKNLDLSDKNMEASRMTLHRFGNTSSSSIWYELAYLEAKGRGIKSRSWIWQLSFGSGFKCNSIVWSSMWRIRNPTKNPWLDCIHRYPVQF